MQFLEVLIRQAHPGPGAPPYRTMDQKMRDAVRYKSEDRLTWPLLVDDLQGATHQVYGALADPSYLIDVDGRVAFYNMWTYAPGLYLAIEELLAQGGRGVVRGGIDHVPHLGATMIHGWRGLRRGLPQSYLDIETSAPGIGLGLRLGYLLRPLFEPWLIRAKPIPRSAKAMAMGAVAALFVAGMVWRNRD